MGGSSSQQHTHQPMSHISSFPTIEESVDEHEIGDEYFTEKQQQQQLVLVEESLRETLEEEARAEKKWDEIREWSCATFENGISESYHNAILFARDKPIITMLEDIRIYLMKRMVAMNEKATTLADPICPSITKELDKLKYKQRYWQAVVSGFQEFVVRKADDGFGVNLQNKTCTCKWWDLSGIPCDPF
ncbi:agenet domain-containing protein [Tanacetum coccineum]